MPEFTKCPICDASNSIKIFSLVEQSLECTQCTAKWSAGEYADGDKWLQLTNPSNINVGTAKSGLMYRTDPVDFWLNEKKPFRTIERYAATFHEYFVDFEDYGEDIGYARFKDEVGVGFIGPGSDLIAVIKIWWYKVNGDYDVRLMVLDRTPMIKETNREQTELFLYMITKKLSIFTEETGIPITPCRWYSGEEQWKEVEENWFIPFKDLDVRPITSSLGDSGLNLLKEFRGLKSKKIKNTIIEAKPIAQKTEVKPNRTPQPVEQILSKLDLTSQLLKSRFCPHCGSNVEVDAVFCGKCGKRVVQ
jgi:hypothetical protein